MKPLNYAILKHFTRVEEACVNDIMDALRKEYSKFKAFNKKSITSAVMTAEANGLIEETRFEMQNGELLVYYHASTDGAATINHYIKD